MMRYVATLTVLLAGGLSVCLTSFVEAQTPDAADVSAQIDAYFEKLWTDTGVEPAELTDDATFIRRVTLDLTGVIPEIGEVKAFLADKDPAKRSNYIRTLLTKSRHATHLSNVWRKVLLPRSVPESTAASFASWLQIQFRQNSPYDEFVREILLAQGTVGQSPPVLFYAALESDPAKLAAGTSGMFLGVQIRCAECHDHPFAMWKQKDFWSYAAFFAQVNGPSPQNGQIPLADTGSGEVSLPKSNESIAPKYLNGAKARTDTGEARRLQLARWMTDDGNPYFAKAAVNRVWSLLFGRGLVEPVDDLGEHNPSSYPEVLDLLARDFVANGYDLRRLFQVIAATRVYQLESGGANQDSQRLETYAVMPVRSLSAEQIFDCLVVASGRRDIIDSMAADAAAQRSDFLSQIESPTQRAIEFQGGIPQALTMLNGPFVAQLTDPLTGDLVAALGDSPFLSNKERIDTLFLATLTRLPSATELEYSLKWCREQQQKGDVTQALSDVLWALLNSSEFILNR